MAQQDINTKHCGWDIIIRGGVGVARKGKEILAKITGDSHADMKDELFRCVEDHTEKATDWTPVFADLDKNVRMGLSQLPQDFIDGVVSDIRRHESLTIDLMRLSFS